MVRYFECDAVFNKDDSDFQKKTKTYNPLFLKGGWDKKLKTIKITCYQFLNRYHVIFYC